MTDLLTRLKAGRSAIRRVNLADDVIVGLRLLTDQDYLEAGVAAEEAMKARKIEVSVSSAELFEHEQTSQFLARAVVDPDTGERLFQTAEALRKALTRSQKSALVAAYLEHEKTYAPSEGNLGEAEFQKLLEAVKKTPETATLNDLSFDTLRRLIVTLAAPPSS